MYSIKVEGYFSAAHNLRGYKGKCESLHGHNWKVEVELCADVLDKIGMLADFKIIKKQLNAVLEKLDHSYLNKLAYFKKVNPTSENIAKFIYDHLALKVEGLDLVRVWESRGCSATYQK